VSRLRAWTSMDAMGLDFKKNPVFLVSYQTEWDNSGRTNLGAAALSRRKPGFESPWGRQSI
jgi:hypothetical protein